MESKVRNMISHECKMFFGDVRLKLFRVDNFHVIKASTGIS